MWVSPQDNRSQEERKMILIGMRRLPIVMSTVDFVGTTSLC
jgi:hypothetical protein